jgi:hypothetical protein
VGERPDELSESCWLVEGDEGVAVFYLGELSLRKELGEALAMLGWHNPVFARPDNQGGTVESRQASGRLAQELRLFRDRTQNADGVAADLRLG